MGTDPRIKEVLKKMFTKQYPGKEELFEKQDPFREYTAWNVQRGLGGCRWCSRCVSTPRSHFGTKPGLTLGFGTLFSSQTNFVF